MKNNYYGIALLIAFFLFTAKVSPQELPNIVFIFADDMGYGDVSCNNPYSKVSTPAIDNLASEGIRFTEAHSAGSVCTPSRYSLLTGRYFFRLPKQSSYWGYLSPYIEPKRKTVGNLLQGSGYTTACIGKWHLGLNWELKNKNLPLIPAPEKLGYTNVDFSLPVTGGPNDLGFDYSYILPASLDMPPYVYVRNHETIDSDIILAADFYPNKLNETVFSWDKKHTNENDIYWERGVWWRNGEMSKSFKVEECMDIFVKEGISFIEREAEKENPFFLYLPLTGPHTPWMPNDEFKEKTQLGIYGDFIAHIDHVVNRINLKLKELDIDKNTIIIFTSDNGGAWQDEDILQYAHQSSWGRRGMKGDAWDGGHHVPLIIKWPVKIKGGLLYEKEVSLIDFFATFADITNQKLGDHQAEDSFSFNEVLNGNLNYIVRNHIIYLSATGKIAIKKRKWKYIEGLGSGGQSHPRTVIPVENGPKAQLYNMEEDALENNNLFHEKPLIVNELVMFLHELIEKSHSRK